MPLPTPDPHLLAEVVGLHEEFRENDKRPEITPWSSLAPELVTYRDAVFALIENLTGKHNSLAMSLTSAGAGKTCSYQIRATVKKRGKWPRYMVFDLPFDVSAIEYRIAAAAIGIKRALLLRELPTEWIERQHEIGQFNAYHPCDIIGILAGPSGQIGGRTIHLFPGSYDLPWIPDKDGYARSSLLITGPMPASIVESLPGTHLANLLSFDPTDFPSIRADQNKAWNSLVITRSQQFGPDNGNLLVHLAPTREVPKGAGPDPEHPKAVHVVWQQFLKTLAMR